MLKDIDFGKVNLLSILYGRDAIVSDWYVKDGDIHFWKTVRTGHKAVYTTMQVEPSSLNSVLATYDEYDIVPHDVAAQGPPVGFVLAQRLQRVVGGEVVDHVEDGVGCDARLFGDDCELLEELREDSRLVAAGGEEHVLHWP